LVSDKLIICAKNRYKITHKEKQKFTLSDLVDAAVFAEIGVCEVRTAAATAALIFKGSYDRLVVCILYI